MRAQAPLLAEPASLGDPLRGDVLRAGGQLNTGKAQAVKSPPDEQPDSAGDVAVPPSLRREPVADARCALRDLHASQAYRAEHLIRRRVNDGEVETRTGKACRFLLLQPPQGIILRVRVRNRR